MSNNEHQESDLTDLTKQELVTKVRSLVDSNEKLKKQISNLNKKVSQKSHTRPGQRIFQFDSCSQRKIALKLTYIGWDYQGFALQDNTENTVEHHVFAALSKTCLIKDRVSCEYSRCGRTDKGVSAFGQVISLNVRAGNGKKGIETGEAIDFVKILNRVLPPEIRIIAWAPVNDDFDARFSCLTRTYKYYFPLSSLDIPAMNAAAAKLIGEHDFRNFCKVDVGNNVNHFIRKIISFDVRRISTTSSVASNDEIYEITICGMAFLWHQVRCMVSVLFLIGLHLEKPEVIDELFDVARYPRKPQYTMVSEIPLILYDCEFHNVDWIYQFEPHSHLVSHFQQMWTNQAVRTSIIAVILQKLTTVMKDCSDLSGNVIFPLMTGHRKNNYQTLLSRPVCEGIEKHLQRQALKRKKMEERAIEKKKRK